jgi:hypothetical protein
MPFETVFGLLCQKSQFVGGKLLFVKPSIIRVKQLGQGFWVRLGPPHTLICASTNVHCIQRRVHCIPSPLSPTHKHEKIGQYKVRD